MESGNEFVDKRSKEEKDALFNNILERYRADKDIISEKALEYDRSECELSIKEFKDVNQTADKKIVMNTVSFEDMMKEAPPLYTETKKIKKKNTITKLELEGFVNQTLKENGIKIKFDFSKLTYEFLDNEVSLPHSNEYEDLSNNDDLTPSAPNYKEVETNCNNNPYYQTSTKSWVIPKKFSGNYNISENNIDHILSEKVKKEDREEMLHNAKTSIEGLKILLKLKEKEYKGPLSMLK